MTFAYLLFKENHLYKCHFNFNQDFELKIIFVIYVEEVTVIVI